MKENPRLVEFDRTRSHAVLETPHQMLRESQQNTHTFRLFTTLTRGRRLALLVGSTFPRFHARYQLPNPRTLSSNHSFDSISMPDRKEQQRILLPYRQSLLVEPRKYSLSRRPSRSRRSCERIAGGKWAFRRRDRVLMSRKACGDIKIPRRVQLGEVLSHIADISLSNEAYIQRWNTFKDSNSSFLPFEVQTESDLFTKKQGIPWKTLSISF